MNVEEAAKLCMCDLARASGRSIMCFHCTGPIGIEKAKAREERMTAHAKQKPSA